MRRRDFIRVTGTLGMTAVVHNRLGVVRQLFAAIPGGSLDPTSVPKFVTPLLVPPAMPRVGKITVRGGKNIDYYEIGVRQFTQQILPSGYPRTTVWGYGPNPATTRGGPIIFNAPSLTIEAKYDTPVRIKWINELVDSEGRYLRHLLPVDPTLHWANPQGGPNHRDRRPEFSATLGAYTGPVPLVTHVHGAGGVGDESDGYAEAWYLPNARNIPDGYAHVGTWYDFFKQKASQKFGVDWTSGSAVFQYPNAQRPSTLWYHDHTLGMTRLNVYAGPAGFFILRGGPGDEVADARSGREAVLPGPAPSIGDAPGLSYFEIPIAIQDRSFHADGALFYPNTRTFFDEIAGPFIPETDVSPIWNPEFFGNMIMVNGNTWPQLVVEQRRYRLRVLNGCQSRFLILDFSHVPGVEAWQIGNEGGYLPRPLSLTATTNNRLLMAPAERADLIIDFTAVPLGRYTLTNLGPGEPFGGGVPGIDFPAADPATTGQILEFRVVGATSTDMTTPPQFLRLPALQALPVPSATRRLALIEATSQFFADAPTEALLGTVSGDPAAQPGRLQSLGWSEPVTENPGVGATEVWEIYNATADAHPIHIHEAAVELQSRQAIVVDETARTVQVAPNSSPSAAEAWEGGRKDTFIAYPEQVTRVRAQFNSPGQYVWHCHIVEHEDNEMMRPYRVGARQPGEPPETS